MPDLFFIHQVECLALNSTRSFYNVEEYIYCIYILYIIYIYILLCDILYIYIIYYIYILLCDILYIYIYYILYIYIYILLSDILYIYIIYIYILLCDILYIYIIYISLCDMKIVTSVRTDIDEPVLVIVDLLCLTQPCSSTPIFNIYCCIP